MEQVVYIQFICAFSLQPVIGAIGEYVLLEAVVADYKSLKYSEMHSYLIHCYYYTSNDYCIIWSQN